MDLGEGESDNNIMVGVDFLRHGDVFCLQR
jgi:hypothetical protein